MKVLKSFMIIFFLILSSCNRPSFNSTYKEYYLNSSEDIKKFKDFVNSKSAANVIKLSIIIDGTDLQESSFELNITDSNLTNLKNLEFHGKDYPISKAVTSLLPSLVNENLISIKICAFSVNDPMLIELANLKKIKALKTLEIIGGTSSPEYNKNSMKSFFKSDIIKNLDLLNFDGIDVDNEILHIITNSSNLSNLKFLYLPHNGLNTVDLIIIGNSSYLKNLSEVHF